jgi:CHAT domain-containing protein
MIGPAFWIWALVLCLRLGGPELPAGLVVEKVRPGSTGACAGLQPGDVLLAWSRAGTAGGPPVQGVLRSPFDWRALLIEELPRGPVSLTGRRGATERTWTLPGGAPSGGERTEEEIAAQPVLGGDPLWLAVQQARSFATAEQWLEADALYEQLIESLEADPQGDLRAVHLLREWGRLWVRRRIWVRAEDCFQRALALARKIAPESLTVAWCLTDLGDLATRGGGTQEPDDLFFQALDLRQRLAPGSSDAASSWRNLGSEALSDGDYPAAEERFRKALALQEKATPGRIYVAERLLAVAAAKFFQKDFQASTALYRQALSIAEREAPEDLSILGILQGIGAAAAGLGEWRQAEETLLRAVALGERLTPASQDQMRFLLYDLGQAQRHLGKLEDSTRHLCRALDLLEERRKTFAGNQELQLTWSFQYAERYGACAQGLVATGRPREAFEALERGRARSFLQLLTERDLRTSELPPPRAAEWKQLTADYDTTQQQLEQARAQKAGQRRLWSLEGRLIEIRRRKERILAENLSLTSLHYPEPLDLAEARQALDPGTALLFYAVGDDETLLFALGSSGFAVFPLPIQRKSLAARIATFRDTLISDRFNSQAAREQGRALYDQLLRPAETFLAGSERLLIIPDGPLHTLPFAALVRQGGSQDQYLIEWKPLHFAISATAYAELRKRRRSATDPAHRQIAAFGDPLASRQQRDLPESRAEVEEISRLFPQARTYLRGEATEENVKRLPRDVRWLHFAVHGQLDEELPINSALVLSPSTNSGEHGNGLLQAWEIMEELRLDADLVTLSACDTALGADLGGEGLIGLTRAFHYAGARSVLATLWGISDKSSAAWMRRFYRELRDGQSKDEAARAAQIEQIRSANGPYPFFWAAFQLYGDWR